MQIKKRFQINVAISAALALIILAVSFLALYRINKANTTAVIAGDIVANALERVTLRNDYVRNGNVRAQEQWLAKQEQITRRLETAGAVFLDPADRRTIDKLARNSESIGRIFSALVENREKRSPGTSAELSREIEDRLLSQLNMRVYEAAVLSRKLVESSRELRASTLRTAGGGILVLVFIAIVASMASSWVMSRTVNDRIKLLQNGASIIGEGNLDQRIDSTGDDEFAELSRAFNAMAGKLRGSYAALEQEIAERRSMNEELQRTATFLDETQSIARVGGWEVDLEKNTLFWTAETYRIHETTPSEYSPTVETAIAFYAPESVPVIGAAVKDAIEQGKEFHLELQLITARGRKIWVGALGKAIRSDGRVVKVLGAFQDITERKQAEHALRESEGRLQFSLETSHIGAWDLDLVDHSAFRSSEHDRIFGYSEQLPQWTFEIFLDHVLPEDRDMVRARFQEAVATQGDWSFECRIRRADGEIRWIWAAGRHRMDGSGKARRMAGIVQDITERKKAEELRQSSAYHRSLLEASLDPLVTISAEGKITDVNVATEQATGRKRGELVGTDFSDYFTDPEKARAGYRQVFAQGFVTDYPLTIRHQDGRLTHVLYNASVYRDGSGTVLGVFAAARDITERKKAQEALQETDDRFRLMIEGVQDYAIVMLDPDGTVTNWNDGAERIKRYRAEEIVGKNFSCFYAEDDIRAGKPASELRQAAETGRFEDEGIRVRKGGSQFFANVIITAIRDEAGNLKGFSKVTRDITERKKAEDEIRTLNRELEARVVERTRELENANKELEAFAYSVSHDLRSPLRSIEGFSHALVEDYADKLDDTGKNYLNRVRAATVRMGQLIDDLLKLSRVTRSEMIRERVDLGAIVREIAGNLQKRDPERKAEVIVKDGLIVSGDARLLAIVFENILSNAWKFSEKSDRTVIKFGAVERDGTRAFFVQDNGVGFDMAYAGKLFNPFQRLHNVEEFAGTGIGLATVKRIVSRHNGRVWIESEMNKGTTVFFTLG